MTQTFNNQVMFGHREWAILSNNNTPLPVGPDNLPLVDKPLVRKKREPSKVDENVGDDSGIVGYMGDDEDIEQAKYNVMSLISDKIGGLDTRLERINQELSVLINSNERDITELRDEVDSEECTPFLISKCDDEQTYEGCTACANYWRDNNQLPENCNQTTIHNHCSYNNTYITQASPGATPVIGSPTSERGSIKVGSIPTEEYECEKLGHFDCNQIITENVAKYQNNMNTICLWNDDTALGNGFQNSLVGDLDKKCRKRCNVYKSEEDCPSGPSDTCHWISPSIGGDQQCVEKICENRIGSSECKAFGNNTSEICGYSRITEGDVAKSSPTLFSEWQSWFGLKGDKNSGDIICELNGSPVVVATQEECLNKGARVVDQTALSREDPLFLTTPTGIKGGYRIDWEPGPLNTGYISHSYRDKDGTLGDTRQIITSCRNKLNIEYDQTIHGGIANIPDNPASFYCTLYDYNSDIPSPDNPCENGADIYQGETGEDPVSIGSHTSQNQNKGCNAKDIEVENKFFSEGKEAADYCEKNLGDTEGGNNPNNCYLGLPTQDYSGLGSGANLSYFRTSPSPMNYLFTSNGRVNDVDDYYGKLRTCNSIGSSNPDCRLLSRYSGFCDSTDSDWKCTSSGYDHGRCGPKKCEDLDSSLGCNLNYENGIISEAEKAINQTDPWITDANIKRDFYDNPTGYCEINSSPGPGGMKCRYNTTMISNLKTLKSIREEHFKFKREDNKFWSSIIIALMILVPAIIVVVDKHRIDSIIGIPLAGGGLAAGQAAGPGGREIFWDRDGTMKKKPVGLFFISVIIVFVGLFHYNGNSQLYQYSDHELALEYDNDCQASRTVSPRTIMNDTGYTKEIKDCLEKPGDLPIFDSNLVWIVGSLFSFLLIAVFIFSRYEVAKLSHALLVGNKDIFAGGFAVIILLVVWIAIVVELFSGPDNSDPLNFILGQDSSPINNDSELFKSIKSSPPKIDLTNIRSCITYKIKEEYINNKDGLDKGTTLDYLNKLIKNAPGGSIIFGTHWYYFFSVILVIILSFFPAAVAALIPAVITYFYFGKIVVGSGDNFLYYLPWFIFTVLYCGTLYLIVFPVIKRWVISLLWELGGDYTFKYDDYFTKEIDDNYWNTTNNLDKLFEPVGNDEDSKTKGTCTKFCNIHTYNLDQNNSVDVSVNEQGGINNPDVCVNDEDMDSGWSKFVDNLGVFDKGDRSTWRFSNRYKNYLKAQVKFNSYINYLKNPNISLLEDSKARLGVKYEEELEGNKIDWSSRWAIIFAIVGAICGVGVCKLKGGYGLWGWIGVIIFGTVLMWLVQILGQRLFLQTTSPFKQNKNWTSLGILVLYVLFYAVYIFKGYAALAVVGGGGERGFRNKSLLAGLVSLCVIIPIIYIYYERLMYYKKQSWYQIATTRYNLYKGKDYDYWINKCPQERNKYKCIVKGGDIETNQENSIFEIKLPDKQSERASSYECEKFNGCLLSDFNEINTVEELDHKCPMSGFTGEDITEIKKLIPQNSSTDCETNIVDKFRMYHGLPGTIYDDNPAFTDGSGDPADETDLSMVLGVEKDFPDTAHNESISWVAIVSLIVFAVGVAKTINDFNYAGSIFKYFNIVYPISFVILIIFMGSVSSFSLNTQIDKFNKYIEPDSEITTDLISDTSDTTRRSNSIISQPPIKKIPYPGVIFYILKSSTGWGRFLAFICIVLWCAGSLYAIR